MPSRWDLFKSLRMIQLVCLKLKKMAPRGDTLEICREIKASRKIIVLGTEYIRGECEVRTHPLEEGRMTLFLKINLHEL